MYLGRRYLLCVLIYTLAWKELEAKPEGETTSDLISTTIETEKSGIDSGTTQSTTMGITTDRSDQNSEESDSEETEETPPSEDGEENDPVNDVNDAYDDDEQDRSFDAALPPNSKSSPLPPQGDSELMDNIKIILIMNSIILLIITLLIISILIYYVLVYDMKNKSEKYDTKSDEQCFCENNHASCISEC